MDGSLPLKDALTLERRLLDDATPFRRQRRPEERIRCLGATFDFIKPAEVLLFLRRAIHARAQVVIANHNSHSLYLVRRAPALKAFYETVDLVQVDSMPVILWSRLLGRRSHRFHRSTYLDWRNDFWRLAAAEGWRVFYLGGAPGVAQAAAERIGAEFPGAHVTVHDGYFDAKGAENDAVVEAINAISPDVLLVGMGMPRQELWIAQNRGRLDARALLPVGAAFDYEAGVQSAAPRWMGRLGVEWAYRLARDPKRLFARYCLEPWFLIGALAVDLLERLGERMAEDARVSDEAEDAALQAAIARRGEWRARR